MDDPSALDRGAGTSVAGAAAADSHRDAVFVGELQDDSDVVLHAWADDRFGHEGKAHVVERRGEAGSFIGQHLLWAEFGQ